ncbi:hypothetical protein HY029_01605 [Candidatus Gottesmanbacteria bacterium]|nr:hypothetical protein [Candidatus Gottesmanbacteria bacterium]
MTRFLPVLFLLSIVFFLLIKPVNAQEKVDTSNVSSGLNPQGGFEDFLNKILSNRLDNINKASLPYEVSGDIAPVVDVGGNTKTVDTNKPDEKTREAGGYTIAAATNLPWEVGKVSLSWTDILVGILDKGKLLLNIGNESAKNFAALTIPDINSAVNTVQTQKVNPVQNSIAQNTSNSTNVLGSADDKNKNQEKMMDISLPLVECANLPFVLCQDKLYK